MLDVLPSEFTLRLIDHHLAQGSLRGAAPLVAAFLGFVLLGFVVQTARFALLAWVGQRAMLDLRMQLFAHLMRRSTHFFHRNPVGRLMTRVISDVQNLNEMFSSGFVAIVGDALSLAAIVVWMFSKHVGLALVAVGIMPLLLVATEVFRRYASAAYRETQGRYAAIQAFLQEQLSGMALVQMNAQEARSRGCSGPQPKYLDAFLRTIFAYAVFFPVVEFITNGTLAALIFYAGFKLQAGTLTLGLLLAFIQQSGRFFRPIRELAERYNVMQTALASSERIFKLLDNTDRSRRPRGPSRWRSSDEIRLEGVGFAYEPGGAQGGARAVRGDPQGPAGGGGGPHRRRQVHPHQPAHALLRRGGGAHHRGRGGPAPGAAQARCAACSGWCCRTCSSSPAPWRRTSPWAGPWIRPGWPVLEQSQLEDLVGRMPDGLQTQVGERGQKLSAGERQLVAFARMLYQEPAILLLDEATANIDSVTEHKIQKVIERVSHRLTTFTIAHRLSTIKDADEIWVMDQGRLVERGDHDSLMARAAPTPSWCACSSRPSHDPAGGLLPAPGPAMIQLPPIYPITDARRREPLSSRCAAGRRPASRWCSSGASPWTRAPSGRNCARPWGRRRSRGGWPAICVNDRADLARAGGPGGPGPWGLHLGQDGPAAGRGARAPGPGRVHLGASTHRPRNGPGPGLRSRRGRPASGPPPPRAATRPAGPGGPGGGLPGPAGAGDGAGGHRRAGAARCPGLLPGRRRGPGHGRRGGPGRGPGGAAVAGPAGAVAGPAAHRPGPGDRAGGGQRGGQVDPGRTAWPGCLGLPDRDSDQRVEAGPA